MTRFFAALLRRYGQRRHHGTVPAVLRAARATMRRKRYCVLATRGDSAPSARVLQPFPPDEDFRVWFGTSPSSRKVQELRRDPHATLVYEDDSKSACVVLEGEIEIVHDTEMRRRYFMPMWRAFFPDGPEGNDFVLLSFRARRIEVWDMSRGITPEPFGLKSAQVVRAEGAWQAA